MADRTTDTYQHFLLLISVVVTLIPFFGGLGKEWKIVALIFGGIFILVYLQDLLKEKVVEITMGSDPMRMLQDEQKRINASLKEDITSIKVWVEAIKHFKKSKSGGSSGLDPFTLIGVIIITILIILVIKGKI